MALSFALHAEDVVIPVVQKPSVLQEGTQRELSATQIAELLPWAKNSKIFLNDLLASMQGLSSADKLDRLEDGIKSVVGESAPKNSELLMRYVLNRALVINDLLKAEMGSDEVGTTDTKLRVFTLSIKMAIKYYDTDMATLNQKTQAPFITFGTDYFVFLSELNKSIFDASASYNIQRTALEWLQWDLYRDLNNQQMASQIVKINNSLKIYPVKKMNDTQYISYIRQMKLMSNQLDLKIPKNPRKIQETQSNSGSSYSGYNNSYTDEQYMNVCSENFSYNANKTSCFSLAKKQSLDAKMISICGSELGDDNSRMDCVKLLKDISADDYYPAAYRACGSNFSYHSNRLACMKQVNQRRPDAKDISACGENIGDDASRINCISILTTNDKHGMKSTIEACGSNFSYYTNRNKCLSIAIENETKNEDIMACGSAIGDDDQRINCLIKIGSQKLDNSAPLIKACGDNFSYYTNRVKCVEIGFEKRLNKSVINNCGKMANDDNSRLSCLKTL